MCIKGIRTCQSICENFDAIVVINMNGAQHDFTYLLVMFTLTNSDRPMTKVTAHHTAPSQGSCLFIAH